MDLINSISGLQQAGVMANVEIAVARKILGMQDFQGQAAVNLIEAASNGVDSAGDALVAAATGLGGQLDTYA